MSLKLVGVSHSIGSGSVLADLSMEVTSGEWLAVVGASGSGRSTLAAIMTGLRRPRHGRVFLEARDVWRHGGESDRRRLGLVMQRAEDQFLGSTVLEDVSFGPRQGDLPGERVESMVHRALTLVGFDADDVEHRSPLAFSGGQRRRLAVAGILALEPSVLVLDEPFAGLDSQATADITLLLSGLRRDGMAIVTLTSDIEPVEGADNLALLASGRIALTGNLDVFIANCDLCDGVGVALPDRVRLAVQLRNRGWNVPVAGAPGTLETAIANEWKSRCG